MAGQREFMVWLAGAVLKLYGREIDPAEFFDLLVLAWGGHSVRVPRSADFVREMRDKPEVFARVLVRLIKDSVD